MRALFGILRIAIAAAVVVAIVAQLARSLENWRATGVQHVGISVTNFFSFFTIESNVATVAVGLIGAWFLFGRRGADPLWFTTFRGAIVTYMVTTGVVYNLLLRGVELPQGTTVPWSNEILHVVAPAYLLLDWLFAPGRSPVAARKIWPMLIFPVAWGLYTLIRGPITPDEVLKRHHWYPYPFLNPNLAPEGYASVAFYIVLIAAIIGLAAAGILWISRRPLPEVSRA